MKKKILIKIHKGTYASLIQMIFENTYNYMYILFIKSRTNEFLIKAMNAK